MMKTFRHVLLLLTVALATVALPGLALAKKGNQAEAHRLEEEMSKLAKRNAWAGVNRSYKALLKLKKVTIKAHSHYLGALASRDAGDSEEQRDRLVVGKREGSSDAASDLSAFDGAFGKVIVKKRSKKKRSLERASMPFAPDQRKSIEFAAAAIKKKGKFTGYLPAGDYTVGGKAFTVRGGSTVTVKKK